MSIQSTPTTAQAIGSGVPGEAPDAQRLQTQLAALVEKGEGVSPVGELRPLLEFFRALLNARALALLPAPGAVLLAWPIHYRIKTKTVRSARRRCCGPGCARGCAFRFRKAAVSGSA